MQLGALVGDSFLEEVIGKFSSLFETIISLCDLKVDPIVVCKVIEVIFIDEFIWDINDLES